MLVLYSLCMQEKKAFLKLYNESVDDIFEYYYGKTHDRINALELTKGVFEKTWATIATGRKASIIEREAEPTDNTDTYRGKSGGSLFGLNYGY
jgi:hypothetical protein